MPRLRKDKSGVTVDQESVDRCMEPSGIFLYVFVGLDIAGSVSTAFKQGLGLFYYMALNRKSDINFNRNKRVHSPPSNAYAGRAVK